MNHWMSVQTSLRQGLGLLLTCCHARARVVEGKTYCPDCGRGVIFRWVILRCVTCGQRRPSRYRFRQVVPTECCCTFCGETASQIQTLEEPEFFQLRYALLQFETETIENPLWPVLKAQIRDLARTGIDWLFNPPDGRTAGTPCLQSSVGY